MSATPMSETPKNDICFSCFLPIEGPCRRAVPWFILFVSTLRILGSYAAVLQTPRRESRSENKFSSSESKRFRMLLHPKLHVHNNHWYKTNRESNVVTYGLWALIENTINAIKNAQVHTKNAKGAQGILDLEVLLNCMRCRHSIAPGRQWIRAKQCTFDQTGKEDSMCSHQRISQICWALYNHHIGCNGPHLHVSVDVESTRRVSKD